MKNIFNKFAFFIALSFVFISCGNLTTSENDDSIPQGKGKITISTDLQNGRSVLPTAITEDTKGLTWELEGTCEGKTYSNIWNDTTSEDGVVTTAYNKMESANDLLLDVGTWIFTLKVKNNSGYVLFATKEVSIETGENKLSFEMKEATSSDIANGETVATGSIEFTLNFPKDVVDKVEATLYKYDNDNTVVDTNRQLTIDNSSNNNFDSVKYSYPDTTGTTGTTSSPLSAGYYILKVELQQNVGVTTEDLKKINTYSCLIRVAPGLTSHGVYTLDELAQLYTVTYNLNEGTFDPTTSAVPTSYNAYTSFELPEPTLGGHYFAGWYTDSELTNPVELDVNYKYRITQDTTLYAKYVKAYTFNLYDSTGKEVENSYKVENGIGSVTLDNTGDSVWDYYLKSTDIEFTEKNNYKITVEMKAEADSVVAIQAANADMFFTVGKEWTPCTMETGFIEKPLDSSRNGISFGLGLSQKTYFKNLVIQPISSDDDGLPTLVFDITTEGINQYLNTQNKADKIIEVKKVVDASGMATGYAITINAPLSHKDENNVVQQNVKLHLRDYAKSVGANNVSFEVKNTGEYPFATSFMADTASNNSMAWNNVRTSVAKNGFNTCNIDFPNYEANDELTVDVITGSDNVYSNYPVEFTISEFKVEEPVATAGPFNGKIFAIQVGETWTQAKEVEACIPADESIEFDVGMFNGWDSNMPSSFDDVTRFFYTDGTGNAYITDDLSYSVNNDNPNAPIFTITNESVEDKIVKITLNENYEVIIEDVSSIVTTWAELKYRIDNTSISEIEITKDLVPTIEIRIGRAIKISSQNNKTISRNQNYTGTFFIVPTASLELSNITLDGGNKNYINATGPLIWAESGSTSLTLTNCILQNNTIVNLENNPMYEQGGAVKTEQPFTMNGGSIINCRGSNGGAVYTFDNGSFTMNGGSISGCTATENGNAVYIGSGNLTLSGDAEIISDVYIANENSVIVAGDLTKDKVATITLPSYDVDRQVITAANGVTLADKVGKFTLKNENYKISDDGRVAQNSGSNEPLEGTEVNSLSALQAAINGDDEVIIITSNITITDPLVINKKIKICTSDLNYQLARTTEGTVKGPMFEVTSDGELTLQNIIITGGYDSGYDDAENNPFIYNNGKTVIENSTLKNNYLWYTGEYKNIESKSIHFYGGGAIFSNGYLTINNSSMENFYINSSSYGGTIYIESGTCNIDGLTISSCSTNKNGAALYISENASSSTVNINNSRIVSNTADTNGGGIYAAAGTINIYNSEINSNSANSGKSVYFKKTVIYSINGNAQVTVTTTSGCNEDITPSTSSISIN